CLAVLLRPGREPVLVAYSRDTEALRRDILETSLAALESPTIVAVLDQDGRPVYARTSLDRAEPVLAGTVARGAAELARGGLRAAGRLAARRGAAPGHAVHRRLRRAGGRHRGRRGAHGAAPPTRDGDGAAQGRLRGQRLPRFEDAALRHPHVRRDARDGSRARRGAPAGVLPDHHPPEPAPLAPDRQGAGF